MIVNDNSHRTAIKRSGLSRPVQRLLDMKYLSWNHQVLDYGCGKGDDVLHLKGHVCDIEGYDPYWRPVLDIGKKYDRILCTYVLNALSRDEDIVVTIMKMNRLLEDSGDIYVTVRKDIKNLNGKTNKGTFQRDINLNLTVISYINYFTTFKYSKLQMEDAPLLDHLTERLFYDRVQMRRADVHPQFL